MAVLSPADATVSSTPVVIATGTGNGQGKVLIATDETIYLGGPEDQNFPIYATSDTEVEYFSMDLAQGDELWAVAASADATVSVLYTFA